jgi:DNA-binding NarL/FixJ family response regulator
MPTADERASEPRPKVAILGRGEPRVDGLMGALERRAIEVVLGAGPVGEVVRVEQPNLVLLVGDAAADAGARALASAAGDGPVPVVVVTDALPVERRLAPFRHGARGVLVRRANPDEMAGEVLHLLGEHARRVSESQSELTPIERAGLSGLRSGELRGTTTPHEGISRRLLGLPASPDPKAPSEPSAEDPETTLKRKSHRPPGRSVLPVLVLLLGLGAVVIRILGSP